MRYDLSKLEQLPLWGKVSYCQALNPNQRNMGWTDWDVTNQASNHWRNMRAKNSKARHRKKFNR